jgi:hypothetical protein
VFEESVATGYPEETLSEIIIYPNPARDYLIISNIQNMQYADIQNLTGKTKWSSKFHGESESVIPVTGLAEGIYIIRLRNKNKSLSRKFIINRD